MRLPLIVLSILLLEVTLGFAHAFSGDFFSDPRSTEQVFVDGKWTYPDEWSDAVKIPLVSKCSSCSGLAYFYAKHDESCFYFLIDFVSDTKLNATVDGASITIDSAHDGGTLNTDDRRFDAKYPSGGTMYIGTGGGVWSSENSLPNGVYMAASLSPSPNSPIRHAIFEFKVTFSAFPNQMQQVIGLAASAHAATQLAGWPANFTTAAPNTWGEVALSPSPIPEFGFLGILAVSGAMFLSLTVLRFRLNHKATRRTTDRVTSG